MFNLNTPINQITIVGRQIAAKLKKLGVKNVHDLLFYWPFRWEDWRKVKKINQLEANTTATIKGRIELIRNKRSPWKKKFITEAIIADEKDSIKAIWFHQPYLVKNLKVGDYLFLSGKVELKTEGLQFVHPQYEKISKYKNGTTHTARIVPVYPLTKNITNKQIRYLMSQAVRLTGQIEDWLPDQILTKHNLIKLNVAVKQMHFPDSQQLLRAALNRIKFDELFLIQLRAALSKQELEKSRAEKIKFREKETKKFVESLPFKLTAAQKIAGWEILKNLEKNRPMNRLLEGDVGSGKTVVAGLAILNAALNNFQVAYMAPTEILATQHYETLTKLFQKWPLKIALLTSAEQRTNSRRAKQTNKKEIYKQISNGKLDLVIGTHALIQDKVEFKNLCLVIIDEQHRFGVKQRKTLKHKGKNNDSSIPHLLSMTATPIPRSLALTVYGDLDLSIIDQMPMGRKNIITRVVAPEKRAETYKFVLDRLKADEQVFVVCPLIDPSDKLGVKAVKDEFEKLDKKIFPNIPIGLMHGKLKTRDKEKVMRDFLSKKTMILVSTPVIEVGIDVANATIMIIESAERFGLAQLHQFRGRVGRSHKQSYCFLFTETDSSETMRRLRLMAESNNGFKLAEADLDFRGPGETYGVRQSGYKDRLRVAKLTDYIIIKKSKLVVEEIMQSGNGSINKFPLIKNKLKQFEESIHFE